MGASWIGQTLLWAGLAAASFADYVRAGDGRPW